MSELKQEFLQRTVTGLALSITLVCLVIFSSDLIFKFFTVLLSLALFLEWMSISKFSSQKKLLFSSFFIILIISSEFLGTLFEPIPLVMIIGITIWIVIAYQIFFKQGRLSSQFRFSNLWIGLILVTTFCLTCFQLTTIPRLVFLVIIFNIAIFDIGAYIVGKRIGKNPFLPELSPNKTLEGLVGGSLSSIIFCISLNFLVDEISWIILFSMILSIPFALCGDYFFSFLKRKADIKDTGSILPGHGGLLDRVDSHLAALPMSLFFILLIQTTWSYF